MQPLKEVAHYVRSKGAGPFWVTIDIFCESEDAFARIRSASSLSADAIGYLYGVEAREVHIFAIESLKVVKVSFPRKIVQGSANDADSHAGQYFVPLLAAPIH